MKRHFTALFVSLLLHGALIALALYLYQLAPKPKESTPQARLSLRSVAIPKAPSSAPSAIESPASPLSQESPLKKSLPQSKESSPKPRPLPKESRPVPKTKEPLPAPKPKESPLASSPSIEQLSQKFQDSDIKELYGDEFFGLSIKEQKYLEDNLRSIGAITQRYLKYPNLAGELGQEGVNAVEFYLHPNGDISDLKLLYGTSYTMLDKNSLKTVELAYKDYPRPSSKTKIRIKVFYRIYGRGR